MTLGNDSRAVCVFNLLQNISAVSWNTKISPFTVCTVFFPFCVWRSTQASMRHPASQAHTPNCRLVIITRQKLKQQPKRMPHESCKNNFISQFVKWNINFSGFLERKKNQKSDLSPCVWCCWVYAFSLHFFISHCFSRVESEWNSFVIRIQMFLLWCNYSRLVCVLG